jgi:c-di-GMP-binding flagellar brake protein YcgR
MRMRRKHIRIKCHSPCILIGLDEHPYEALLENLSLNGALIKVNNGVPDSIQVGGECGLMVCHTLNVCSVRRPCKVIRYDSVKMGVKFLTNIVH